MGTSRFFRSLVISLLVGAACDDGSFDEATAADEAAVADEALAESEEELGTYVTGPHTWQTGTWGPTRLEQVATHVCVLARVSGNFRGGGEALQVYQSSDGYWYLGGRSQTWVSGSAYCFRRNRFTGPAPSGSFFPERWLSGEGRVAVQTGSAWSPFTGWMVFPAYSSVDMWQGDAATFITGISGELNGGGEWVSVAQANDGWTPSRLYVRSNATWAEGRAHSFFVGAPQTGRPARFWGPAGVGAAGASGEYSVTNGQVFMAPTDTAMCYLTEVRGALRGAGEVVELFTAFDVNGRERWVLRTQSGQDGMTAAARCFLFNQN
jgi:hypothetical protein